MTLIHKLQKFCKDDKRKTYPPIFYYVIRLKNNCYVNETEDYRTSILIEIPTFLLLEVLANKISLTLIIRNTK